MSIAPDKSVVVQFAGQKDRWEEFQPLIINACKDKGVAIELHHKCDPSKVEYLVYSPSGPVQDFTEYSSLKAVLNLWAGVEQIVGNPTLKVPLCRMVDPGLTAGMVEWVTGHVLRYHLGIDDTLNQQDGVWRAGSSAPLAQSRRVGILGLGQLGTACGRALVSLGFEVYGWSRREKSVPGITSFSGDEGLKKALSVSDIAVLLMPDTPETRDIINSQAIAQLPRGAKVLNPGRGTLIDDDALLAALKTGQISHATLDVFKIEPLPADHAYWSHPKVTVTPHIAAETRSETSSEVVAENIRRGEAGEPFLYEVDKAAGY